MRFAGQSLSRMSLSLMEANGKLFVDLPVVDETTVCASDLDVAGTGNQAGRRRNYRVVPTVHGDDLRLRAQRALKVLREGAAASRHVAVRIEQAPRASAGTEEDARGRESRINLRS